nr:MAG TPA: hypothetical protein [Caudoviricetes sp.]
MTAWSCPSPKPFIFYTLSPYLSICRSCNFRNFVNIWI